MSVIHGANYGTPTLDLNFAKNKSLIDTVSGRDLVTFTRSSTGTYVDSDGLIKYAAADEPRFDHNPITGECLGLLIEESRTNLLTYSDLNNYLIQSFTSIPTTWMAATNPPGGITINVTSAVNYLGPDGIINATKIAPNVGWSMNTGAPRVANGFYNSITFTGNNNITSVYFKPVGCDTLILQKGNYSTTNTQYTFNTSNMSHNGYSFTYVGNGWYRAVTADDNRQVVSFGCSKSDGGAYNGIDGVLLWGAQLEEGSFPTSYIPTAGSTVTRSADNAEITGTNFSRWYNPLESTWYAEGDQTFINSNGNQDGVNSLFVDRYANISTQRWRENSWRGMQGSTGIVPPFTTATTPKGSKAKTAYAIDGTYARMSVEGVLSAIGSLGSYPGVTALIIGESARLLVNDKWRGHISRLTYYPTRLQNYQLQQLTK